MFINLLSTSIHGYQEKRKKKKNPPGARDKNVSNHRLGEKKKKYHRIKIRIGQLRHIS